MRKLSSITGPIDYSEEPGAAGNTPEASKKSSQELIIRASAVPILYIFKTYNIRVDVNRPIIRCPFKFHKNGQESTPSFKYYQDTNSFNCFGCSRGGGPVHFVAGMDNTDKVTAAIKILELFDVNVNEDLIFEGQNYADRVKIMSAFSEAVLDFRQNHDDEHAFEFIEYVCWVYDRMNLKHRCDSDALHSLNQNLIDWIQSYSPTLRLTFEEEYLRTTCKLL